MCSGLLSKAKTKIVHGGRRTYIVPFGLYQGLKLELDLRSDVRVLTGLFELETHRQKFQTESLIQSDEAATGGS